MTSNEPPGNPGGTSSSASGKMTFDNTKKLSNESQGEKILLMHSLSQELSKE
jgi:hypothetical protein